MPENIIKLFLIIVETGVILIIVGIVAYSGQQLVCIGDISY